MFARSIALVLCLLLAQLGVSANADTLSEVRKTGILKIGYREDIPPFSSLAEDGKPQGFSIDICNRIAAYIGQQASLPNLRVEFVRVTAASRLTAVARGQVQLECGNTTSTLSRQELVDFSNLFYVSGASFMTTADVEVNAVGDLQGRSVAVVENTTTLTVLQDQLRNAGVDAKLQVVSSHNQALKLLESGTVDMVAADRATLLGLGFTSEKLQILRLTPVMLSFEPYAFPLPRNDADFRLMVNRALSEIYLTGQIGELWQKWFGSYEVKPTQLLLNVYRLNSLAE